MWPSAAWSHRQLNTQAVRVSFDCNVAELVVGWTISRPDVNRSAGRTVGQPSICCGDGERVVTTAHADALVSRAGEGS